MHQFPAPPKPLEFEAAMAAPRARLAAFFEPGANAQPQRAARRAKAKPARGAQSDAAEKEVELFPAKWSRFKDVLSAAQHRKCAFCEGWAIGQGFGDVEHYAPKAEVEALDDADPDSWGAELPNLANVSGRRPKAVSATGYWWLAYEWENYVLACQICNQQWKRALFPIREARARGPRRGDAETHTLLHPFRGPSPRDHLEYGLLGEVRARAGSVEGFETIRTLGLDRPSLREQRRALASKIHRKLDGLAAASAERTLELLQDIRVEGDVDQPFCGMVRAIFEQRTRMRWSDLETRLAATPNP